MGLSNDSNPLLFFSFSFFVWSSLVCTCLFPSSSFFSFFFFCDFFFLLFLDVIFFSRYDFYFLINLVIVFCLFFCFNRASFFNKGTWANLCKHIFPSFHFFSLPTKQKGGKLKSFLFSHFSSLHHFLSSHFSTPPTKRTLNV